MEPWWLNEGALLGLIVFGPVLSILAVGLLVMVIGCGFESLKLALMTEEQKAAYKQRNKEKAAKDAAALAKVREIEAESRMRKYQCPVCGYSSADNEFLDLYGKQTGVCICRKCGKRFYC